MHQEGDGLGRSSQGALFKVSVLGRTLCERPKMLFGRVPDMTPKSTAQALLLLYPGISPLPPLAEIFRTFGQVS